MHRYEWTEAREPPPYIPLIAPPAPEEGTEEWCNRLFPPPHNDLQMGVVDFLLFGGASYVSRSLATVNMAALAPHIQHVLADAVVPEDDAELVAAIAKAVRDIEQRAYTLGITGPPKQQIFRTAAKIGSAPMRKRLAWTGHRVIPLEGRHSENGGVKSSRLHALQTCTVPMAKRRSKCADQLSEQRALLLQSLS